MSNKKKIPNVGAGLFLLSLMELGRDPLEFIRTNREKYGDIFRVSLPIGNIVVVTTPELAQHVLQEKNRNYQKSFAYDILKIFLGNGLLTSEGDFWRKQRRLAQPAFHKERLAEIVKTMSELAGEMAEEWKEIQQKGEPFDITIQMNRITLDIVSKALFGADVRSDLELVRNAITVANEFAIARIRYITKRIPLWLPTKDNREFKKAGDALDNLLYSIIDNRMANPIERHDLLAMLMEAKDEDTGEGMSHKQLRDEAMTLFIAGHETSALALSWAWYLLATHPEVMAKLKAELKEVLDGRLPGFADIPRLTYTRQIVDETLRLFPPAYIIGRRPIDKDDLGGHIINKNTNVLVAVFDIHRNPDLWDEPDKFKPERFAPENVKKIPKYAYFPFGGGPRLCIGNNFALMEMQIVLATLAQSFDFTLVSPQKPEFDPLITLRSKNSIMMQLN